MTHPLQLPCSEGVVLARKHVDAPCARADEKWILLSTIAGSSMAFIDGTVVNLALPALQRELGATLTELQWIVEGYALMLAALLLVGGALGDRLGRRRVFVAGVALFGSSSVGCALASGVPMLVAMRALQGVGGALLVPGSLALISASIPEARRGRAIGVWSAFSAISSGLGLVLGGFLIDALSWSAIFWINVPLAALTILLALWKVPESKDEAATGPLDWGGAFLASAGLAGLTFGFVEAGHLGWSSAWVIGAIAGGALLLGAFIAVERRVESPLVPPSLFRSRGFTGANLLTLFLYAALAGSLFFLPLDLVQVQGYSAIEAGAATLPFVGLLFVLSRWSGGLVDRFGARPPLLAGTLLAAAGMAALALPGVGGGYVATFFGPLIVLGLGMALAVAPLTTTVMSAVSADKAGAASGINNAISRIASVLAVAVFGPVMLLVFQSSLDARLAELGLTAEATASVQQRSADLAGLVIPDAVPESARDEVSAAVRAAFVDGFRVVALLCAGLSLAATACAALLIPAKLAPPATGSPE